MLIAKNNLKQQFDDLYQTIKEKAEQGISYNEIYLNVSKKFNGTKPQFYALYRARKELKEIQSDINNIREKNILSLLKQGKKILHIAQDLKISRSVVYDVSKKYNIHASDKVFVKKVYNDYAPEKVHDKIPKREHHNFVTFLYFNNQAHFADDNQCKNIFPAIDSRGDYWCGNYCDTGNPSRQKKRYCTDCHKIVFSKKKG